MFIAAIMSAYNYHEDFNYSINYWKTITGLSKEELRKNEILFLNIINYKLHINIKIFEKWCEKIIELYPHGKKNKLFSIYLCIY